MAGPLPDRGVGTRLEGPRLKTPQSPRPLRLFGGPRFPPKSSVLKNLVGRVDLLIVRRRPWQITFLFARWRTDGKSLHEADQSFNRFRDPADMAAKKRLATIHVQKDSADLCACNSRPGLRQKLSIAHALVLRMRRSLMRQEAVKAFSAVHWALPHQILWNGAARRFFENLTLDASTVALAKMAAPLTKTGSPPALPGWRRYRFWRPLTRPGLPKTSHMSPQRERVFWNGLEGKRLLASPR